MPDWNLGTFLSRLTTGLGQRSDLAASDVSFWTNEAQRQVWDVLPLFAQQAIAVSSTTSGENNITLPTDMYEIINLSNLSAPTGKQTLDEANLDNADSWTTTLGTPTHYVRYADWLTLLPTPDSSYSLQLRYRKLLSDMTVAASVPSVATRYHYAVFLKAKELLAQNETHDATIEASSRAAYISYMNATPNDRALEQRENRFRGMALPRSRHQTPESNVARDFDHRIG